MFSISFRFEFSVSMVELHRRTLDVAVKNGGSILSKHKGLLGKVNPFLCNRYESRLVFSHLS